MRKLFLKKSGKQATEIMKKQQNIKGVTVFYLIFVADGNCSKFLPKILKWVLYTRKNKWKIIIWKIALFVGLQIIILKVKSEFQL